jgi:hypothetical protein
MAKGPDRGGNRSSVRLEAEAEPDEIGDVDERFRALLEGLRTSLPGVQVLFGFLLVAPFQREFSEYDSATIISFTVAFLSAGLASVLLIAPSVHQRVRAPMSGLPRRSERHLTIAIWLTIAGTVVMGVAIVATVLLVSTFVFADVWAVLAAAVLAGGMLWAWFYLPLIAFRR